MACKTASLGRRETPQRAARTNRPAFRQPSRAWGGGGKGPRLPPPYARHKGGILLLESNSAGGEWGQLLEKDNLMQPELSIQRYCPVCFWDRLQVRIPLGKLKNGLRSIASRLHSCLANYGRP